MNPADILKATPLFSALDEAELKPLASCAGVRTYTTGELLFSEGERPGTSAEHRRTGQFGRRTPRI